MSQQINLLLPALRPRFDWLALPVVAGVALAGLVLISILAVLGLAQAANLKASEAEIRNQLAAVQQQVQTLGQSLAARQGDTSLDRQIATARLALTQRQEVLAVIAQGDITQGSAYSGLLQGFSRQTVDGVWLVGFGFADKEIEIRGRLLDPALLPTYINRLNDEPAFAGRRFATLDMKGFDPADDKRSDSPPSVKTKVPARYTEFALRTELIAGQEKAR
ncbi:PilN domain-containing protein [Ferribacterium limneticum]|uniref:PilN domain-containing protein n=1 Tax=Ferribacterium limneticum TaxID=76259 RepID=UPI001CF8F02A|nr:PilN domain-containing protein [Ferribacterium limneticum]UCV23918.1 PilN domain-containing protein [Ferribacterium limneticum]